jgi:hypothetical protein
VERTTEPDDETGGRAGLQAAPQATSQREQETAAPDLLSRLFPTNIPSFRSARMSDLPDFLAPVLEDVRPPCRNGPFAPTDGLPSSPSTAGLAPLIDRPPPARPPCGRRPTGDPLPAPGRRRTAGKGRAQADCRPLRLAPGRCRHVGFVAAAQGAQLACQKTRRLASRADDPADLGNLLSRLAPDAARRSSATGPTRPAPHAWCVALYPQGGESQAKHAFAASLKRPSHASARIAQRPSTRSRRRRPSSRRPSLSSKA